MKTRSHCLFFSLLVVTAVACRSVPRANSTEQPKLTNEDFFELDWQRQVEYLEALTRSNLERADKEIISAALSDDDSAVVIAALETIQRLELDAYLPRAIEFLTSDDPITRWRALLIVEILSSDIAVLPSVIKLTTDKEWLVREAAYRTVRKFKAERSNKAYFYTVLFHLNEKNPQVVAEIYRTLVWYDDETAWPYMMKRSYHCKSASELILVMRELARTKTRDAQVRLKTLTRSQSVIVRQEANELLRKYF